MIYWRVYARNSRLRKIKRRIEIPFEYIICADKIPTPSRHVNSPYKRI